MALRVSDNRRYLIHGNGKPFFYLGDTAWELIHRLKREEADLYLRDRAQKGFTVIQAVVLAEQNGLREPNAYGDLPLHDEDPAHPNEAYFQHVDWIVRRANALGLYVGLLPTWGDKVHRMWGAGPEIFTPDNAEPYGEFLGRRYRGSHIIWILGGDRPVETNRHLEIWRALAAGLRKGDGGTHLITYHPMGWMSSADKLHAEPWLDFNMIQSGHSRRNAPNYELISRDYQRVPIKPCMDGEPCYEDHPVNWREENGYFSDYDVRKAAYWALFAGAHGHTYGAQPIWQMWAPPRPKVSIVRRSWREALALPGAAQMRHVKELMLPRVRRLPDQDLLPSDAGSEGEHIRATRDEHGRWALVYLPVGQPVSIDTGKLRARTLNVSWLDPRSGTRHKASTCRASGVMGFAPPSSGLGQDWVLILEDSRAS